MGKLIILEELEVIRDILSSAKGLDNAVLKHERDTMLIDPSLGETPGSVKGVL